MKGASYYAESDGQPVFEHLLKKQVKAWQESHDNKKLAEPTVVSTEEMQQTLGKIGKYAATFGFGMFCLVYALAFREYKQAVEKHQTLTQVFTNPNARVATGDKAKQVLEQVQQTQKKDLEEKQVANARQVEMQTSLNRLNLLQQLYAQPLLPQVQAPTLANLPPSTKSDHNFNYSLCESIDYQKESLTPTYTMEQVHQMLA